MTRWEYYTTAARHPYDLVEVGEHGWELCGVLPGPEQHLSLLIFKRPLQENQPISIVRRS